MPMPQESIPELLEAYGRGDSAAQEALLLKLEELLRSLTRKLIGKQIRSERESMDVCQSLLLAFHLAAAKGKLQIENEKALRAYLRAMIRHKLANLSDRMRAAKRGRGTKALDVDDAGLQLPALDPTASMVARTAEARLRLERELSEEERAILEGRLAGRANREIAKDLGKSPDAVRMIWNRTREHLAQRGILEDPRGP